ncbi:hypothetical protein ACEQ8H_008285 [Pleosporales sp. CAS-2024a]
MADDEYMSNFAKKIASLNSGQIVKMMRTIHDPSARALLMARLMALKPDMIFVPIIASEKPKKAMNGYVGYRCYLKGIPLFEMWPMKKISFYIGQLWKYEPDKPLWTLMTKAWSSIRDQVGKDNAPLDRFFQIVCPKLNILPPELYLEGRGWRIEYNADGTPTLSHDPKSSSAAALGFVFSGQTLSVADIIKMCQDEGYGVEYEAEENDTSPTFLGHNVQEMRVAARKDRRARRQAAGQSLNAQALRQRESDFYDSVPTSIPHDDHDPTEFINHLMGVLSRYDTSVSAQDSVQANSSLTPTAALLENSTDISIATDMSAFRLGADADATLPAFDFNTFHLG